MKKLVMASAFILCIAFTGCSNHNQISTNSATSTQHIPTAITDNVLTTEQMPATAPIDTQSTTSPSTSDYLNHEDSSPSTAGSCSSGCSIDNYQDGSYTPPAENCEDGEKSIVNRSDGMYLSAEQTTYAKDVEKINATFRNNTGREFTLGLGYTLQSKKDGKWVDVPFVKDYQVMAIAAIISSGDTHTVAYPINEYTGDLSGGIYRIVVPVNDQCGNAYELTSLFSIA